MKKETSFTLLLTVFLVGCTHYYYVPNVQNIPLFRDKNELQLSGEVGSATDKTPLWGKGDTRCMDLQAAYSLSTRIGFQLNYMSLRYENNVSGNALDDNSMSGNYYESALGYFNPIGKHGVFELYGGIGLSDQHHVYANSYNNLTGTADLNFTKLFLQPALGLTYSSFDIALSSRIYTLRYNNIDASNNDIANYENFNSIQGTDHVFIEPAFTIRTGWRVVKVQFQYVYVNKLNPPYLHFYERSHVSLGLLLSLGGGVNNSKKLK